MRYVMLILIALMNALIMCGVSAQFNIFGSEMDLLLVMMILMLMFEKKVTPVLCAAIGGLAMDSLFARGLGFYTLPYVITGMIFTLIISIREPKGIWMSCLFSAAAFLVKEIVSIILCILLGYQFDILHRIVSFSLPGIPLQAVLCFAVYFIYKWLYSFAFMQPSHDPEYKLMFRRRRRRR
ncbi:MAG: hypothetical protein IKM38_05770 [Christensenellaceae bacterium]|nr:hypothetical protein [Christensenellaceae bacterium]